LTVRPEQDDRNCRRQRAVLPIRARAATKAISREQVEVGTGGADEITPEVGGRRFGTEDLHNAVASFLADGPGKATYAGR
jgi:hypothetical protein